MSVNAKKTCCLRIGPRADISCTHIQTLNEISLHAVVIDEAVVR